MRTTKVYFDKDARERIFKGMEVAYKAVSVTAGSRGRNVVYDRWGAPIMSNDGISILREIFLEELSARQGVFLIRGAAERTNEDSGDGTTTATILAYHLIKEGTKILDKSSLFGKKISGMQLRREMEEALDEAINLLNDRAIKATTEEELFKIAKISSENDEIAKMVSRCVQIAGETGRVVVEESQLLKTEEEKIAGMEIEGGYISPYFVTNPEKQEAVLENPYVLVTDKTFVVNKEIMPLLEEIYKNGGTSVVIVAKDIQGEALTNIVLNNTRLKGKFACIGVKAPRNFDFLEDLAVFTGKKDAISGTRSVKAPTMADLRIVRKVVASKDKCLFVKDERNEQEKAVYEERVDSIRKLLSEAKGEEKKILEDRLARITSSVVVIKVGGNTDSEIPYLRMKMEDAVSAVRAAMKEGYVPGGGVTLFDIGNKVYKKLGTKGALVLKNACQKPAEILAENSGVKLDKSKVGCNWGFNTDTCDYVNNMIVSGIIDPVLVEKNALINATKLAALFLTVGTDIVKVPEPVQVQE